MNRTINFFYVLSFITGLLFVSNPAVSQDSKVSEVKVKVLGNCGMCKDRIERAAYTVKGVRKAEWNQKEQQLTVTFRNDRTEIETIERAIAKAGHDTANFLADDETHANLHTCCVYERDEELLKTNKLWNQE
jgi:periplasmic mercuric ion binding protein